MNLQKRFTYTISFTTGQAFLAVVSLLFAAYLGWEIYWWNKIGLYFIKWHTHIVFTALLFAAIFFPFWVLCYRFKKHLRKEWLFALCAIWMSFVLIEIVLIITGSRKEYVEQRFGYYQSPYLHDSLNYYNVFGRNDTNINKATEYTHTIIHNSLGYSGAQWSNKKDSNRIRILTIGDSFTEGDGASRDSSYPALMQEMSGSSLEILNAGIRGSDPVFGIKNLEDRLLPYKPDIVIQAISENDVLYDMCIRGGLERFVNDTVVKFRKPPVWEPIYAMSYTSRIFFNAFGFDMKTPCGSIKHPAFIVQQNRLLQELFDQYEKAAAANHIKVLFVFYPTKFEVFRDAYDFDFNEAKKYLEKLPHVGYVDLFPCYRNTIKSSGKKAEDYYWKIDGHHNATGYKMMAECVAEKVLTIVANDTTLNQATQLN